MDVRNPEEVTERGLEIYTTRLRPQLEPQDNGNVVAIHVDTADYAVASTSGDAMRMVRARHPQGALLLHTIGTATEKDYGLIMRMRGLRPVGSVAETVK